jgi:hypothetical protein
MVRMTQSFSHWLLSNYPEKYSLILFGHLELLTEEMKTEYAEWVVTDEGSSYLKGGKNYKDKGEEE